MGIKIKLNMKKTASSGKNKLFSLLLLFTILVSTYAQQNPNLYIKVIKNADNSVDFNYEKAVEGSFIVKIKFNKLENADSKSVPVLNVKDKSGLLFKLHPLDKNKKIDLSFTYVITRGYLNPTIDSTATYELPFEEGKKVKIYWGTMPGISPNKWKKYIVYSNTQDNVFAMRNGIVVEVRTLTRFDKDDKNQEANKVVTKDIIVEHADGTYACYSGIVEESIAVKIGQNINSQDYMGLMEKSSSGRYGLTFEVYYHESDENEFRGNLVAVNPNFLTPNGSEKLENKKEYVVKHN